MSCSICRLPFVPGPGSVNPDPKPPPGILTDSQYRYFAYGFGIGTRVMFCIQPFEYFAHNMFGGKVPFVALTTIWESHGGTVFVVHKTCAALLRRILNCEEDIIPSGYTLCEIQAVLGRPQDGAEAGRMRFVNYEVVGEKVDLRPFWHQGQGDGENTFDWSQLVERKLDWVLSKPDVFPRFSPTVTPDRFGSIDTSKIDATPRTDTLTTRPADILHCILPYLSIKSYIYLMSTCRFFRFHALTTFQPHARKLVLDLGWAVPLKGEYENAKSTAREAMASEEHSSQRADWLLYLRRVHRTKSMRVRRWIWALCLEMKRAYEEKLEESPYADKESQECVTLRQEVQTMMGMNIPGMRG